MRTACVLVGLTFLLSGGTAAFSQSGGGEARSLAPQGVFMDKTVDLPYGVWQFGEQSLIVYRSFLGDKSYYTASAKPIYDGDSWKEVLDPKIPIEQLGKTGSYEDELIYVKANPQGIIGEVYVLNGNEWQWAEPLTEMADFLLESQKLPPFKVVPGTWPETMRCPDGKPVRYLYSKWNGRCLVDFVGCPPQGNRIGAVACCHGGGPVHRDCADFGIYSEKLAQ